MNDKVSFSTSIKNSAFIKNPVLFESIGIAPVVAMAVSVKTAIMLSVISAAELIIIECFASIALKKVKHEYRVLIYALLGVLINVPFWLFLEICTERDCKRKHLFADNCGKLTHCTSL